MHDGVNLGTVVPLTRKRAAGGDGVEPGHTPRPKIGRRVRMLLSFQRPSPPLQKEASFPGALRDRDSVPEADR